MYQTAKQFLLPPNSLIIGIVLVLILFGRCRNLARWSALILSIALYVFSTPLGATSLAGLLEVYPPLPLTPLPAGQAQAIVILGGDTKFEAEFGGETVGIQTLLRVRYGARLQARTGLPILVSGGVPPGQSRSIAAEMADVLVNEFHGGEVWQEDRSQTTWENAADSAILLKKRGIGKIYLVTVARDMPRAVRAFRRSGLTVTPAPTAFDDDSGNGIGMILPSVEASLVSYYAFYELAGGAYYDLFQE